MRISNRTKFVLAIIALVSGLGMIGGAWWKSSSDDERVRQEQKERQRKEDTQKRRDLLSGQITKLLGVEEEANRVAILRAESDLKETFRRYSARAPQFAEAVTGWRNRLAIAAGGVKDGILKTEEVRNITAELFAEHVVSDQQLRADLGKIVLQMQNDMVANRNWMLSEASMRIREADVGVAEVALTQDALMARLAEAAKANMTPSVRNSPWIGVFTVAGSGVAGMGAEYLAAQLVRMAAGSIISATVGGGGVGSSLVPGLGTVIGLVVGLVVGVAVDHSMTERTQAIIAGEVRLAVATMRRQIWSDPANGLNIRFSQLVELNSKTHNKVLRALVSGERS